MQVTSEKVIPLKFFFGLSDTTISEGITNEFITSDLFLVNGVAETVYVPNFADDFTLKDIVHILPLNIDASFNGIVSAIFSTSGFTGKYI